MSAGTSERALGWLRLVCAIAVSGLAHPARAQPEPGPDEGAGAFAATKLLGDPAGWRSRLDRGGLAFGLREVSEVWANLTGGLQRGAIYEGLTTMSAGLDTGKAFGLPGGTLHASALHFHGRGLSGNNLGAFSQTSDIEQDVRGTKLWELWYEQNWPQLGLSVRAGQMSADLEFMSVESAGLLLNSAFGWPVLPSIDLPSGGPAYPLGTPGVRLAYRPSAALSLLLGVFNGDPAGPGADNPEQRDAAGTAFRLNDGAFAIAEIGYEAQSGFRNLPGTFKLGGWFNSQSVAAVGNAAASDAGPGRRYPNIWSLYALADQHVWRRAGEADGGIAVFVRVMAAPSDRNLIDADLQAGVTWKGLLSWREDDSVGFGLSHSHLSRHALPGGSPHAAGHAETTLELTYLAVLTPYIQLQPDLQYVVSPGGGLPGGGTPTATSRPVRDAQVVGVQTLVSF